MVLLQQIVPSKVGSISAYEVGVKDLGLWLSVMLPAGQPYLNARQNALQSFMHKGVCSAYNETQCK